jgi:hypothetical protein
VPADDPSRLYSTNEIRRNNPVEANRTITKIPSETHGLFTPEGGQTGVADVSGLLVLGSGAPSAHVQCLAHIMLAFCMADEKQFHLVLR